MEAVWAAGSYKLTAWMNEQHLAAISDHVELQKPSPSEIRVLQGSLQSATASLQDAPHSPSIWKARAEVLLRLHYPDLAIGDAVSGLMLIEESRKEVSEVRQSVRYEIARDLCSTHSQYDILPSEFLGRSYGQYEVQSMLEELELATLTHLAKALLLASCFFECLDLILDEGLGILRADDPDSARAQALMRLQRNGKRFPDSQVLFRIRKTAKIAHEADKKQHLDDAMTEDGSAAEIKKQIRSGAIMVRPFPWMAESASTSRPQSVVQLIQDNLENASEGHCTLKRSCVRSEISLSDGNDSDDVYGIFSKVNLAVNQTVFCDRTCLYAVSNPTTCCSACTKVPTGEIFRPSCCKAVYCSRSCFDRALNFYHAAVCGKGQLKPELTFLSATSSEEDEDGIFFRILAFAAKFCQGHCFEQEEEIGHTGIADPVGSAVFGRKHKHQGFHPLQAPILSRLTPMYELAEPARFSLTKDVLRPMKMVQQLGISIWSNPRFDTWVLQTIQARMKNNWRDYTVGLRAGLAIHPLYTFCNHSCNPNVRCDADKFSRTLEFVCHRRVKAGEELLISYISRDDLSLPVVERRDKLSAWIGGDCQCIRCKREAGEDVDDESGSAPRRDQARKSKIRRKKKLCRRSEMAE